MYINNKILVGKNLEKEVYLLPQMANRHGLITGASGSGKTITLKVMAESFSQAGIPVFLVDVKGDLAGMSFPGEENENVTKRVENLGLEGFSFQKYPTTYYDVNGVMGHPIRTTVSSVGARLLSRMLDLSDTQEEVLGVVFKIAEDEGLELIDLNDLNSILTYVDEKRKEYSSKYGNISTQSITSIKRSVLNLMEASGDLFFGKPSFDVRDFMNYNENGYGYINVLDAQQLFKTPTTYVIMLLWLLTTIYHEMPEVGDLEKPKLVFFFDEAHLIFSEMKENVVKQLIQIVKLIRSKGVGLYFVSQSPSDIRDEVLSQLGNRVQHVLRAYTKSDEKSIRVAADSFRKNPNFDTAEMIQMLGTGEALVSFQNEKGEPEVVEKVTILPPQSRMGTITSEERNACIRASRLYGKYDEKINVESAEEKVAKWAEQKQAEEQKKAEEVAKAKEEQLIQKEKSKQEKASSKSSRKSKTTAEKFADKVVNKTLDTASRKIVNAVFKNIFK